MTRQKLRELVYGMYGGKCGYTGKPLDDTWEIDHKIPRNHPIWYQPEETKKQLFDISYSCNDAENLIPALRIVNHYKGWWSIEEFRAYLKTFHVRLAKLPKKTIVAKTERRKVYMYKIAEAFGITQETPFDGAFYFEKIRP